MVTPGHILNTIPLILGLDPRIPHVSPLHYLVLLIIEVQKERQIKGFVSGYSFFFTGRPLFWCESRPIEHIQCEPLSLAGPWW